MIPKGPKHVVFNVVVQYDRINTRLCICWWIIIYWSLLMRRVNNNKNYIWWTMTINDLGQRTVLSTNLSIVDITHPRWNASEIPVRSTEGMILTGETPSTGRKPSPSTALFTRNPSLPGQVLNPGLRSDRPTSTRRSDSRSVETGRTWVEYALRTKCSIFREEMSKTMLTHSPMSL
jgi:hypothetical protein